MKRKDTTRNRKNGNKLQDTAIDGKKWQKTPAINGKKRQEIARNGNKR